MKMKLQLVLAVFLLIGTMIWTNCVFVQPPPPGEGGMSVEGWCCRNGDVFPCSEHECYDTGGAFFLYEHEAIAHCEGQMQGQMPPGEGWCCDNGHVSPGSETECHGWGGVFFLYEHEAVAHCHGSAPGPSTGGKPVINYFTANPSMISAGQSSTLSWDVWDTNTVHLTAPGFKVMHPLGAVDKLQVSPTATTTYTLTATNAAGTVTGTAEVKVGIGKTPSKPVINKFTVNPSTIAVIVGSAKLEWNVSGATNISLTEKAVFAGSGGHTKTSILGSPVGNMTLSPAPVGTYTYTLSATNTAGTVTKTVQLTVGP